MAILPAVTNEGGGTEPASQDLPPREVAYLPLPFVDESEGGWCSDKPRRPPRTEGSWLDYEA